MENLFAKGTSDVLRWALSQVDTDDSVVSKQIQVGFARGGHCELFQSTVKKLNENSIFYCSRAAAMEGHLDFLKMLKAHYKINSRQIATNAAEMGHLHILQWLRSDDTFSISIAAARCGRVEILEWQKESGVEFYSSTSLMDSAVRGGQINVLKWLKDNSLVDYNHMCYNIADANDDIIKWYILNGFKWDAYLTSSIAKKGKFEVLKWCVENGCVSYEFDLCRVAANLGNLEMLKWLVDHGLAFNATVTEAAALAGHLEILQWLRSKNCEWNVSTCVAAAKMGRKDIIRWAIDNGLSWDKTISYGAAYGGHIDLLKWLISSGCPVEDDICVGACDGGQLDTLLWCVENGYEPNVSECLKMATQLANKSIVKWFVDQQTAKHIVPAPPPTQQDIDDFFQAINVDD